MTDLEITRLCAEAIGLTYPWGHLLETQDALVWRENINVGGGTTYHELFRYSPLHDDAQAMALVKDFGMHIIRQGGLGTWLVSADAEGPHVSNQYLNRAICECVAKIQEAKRG